RYRRAADRHLSIRDAGRLAARRPHPASRVRCLAYAAEPLPRRRQRTVLCNRPGRMGSLRVIRAGLHTTIQDPGRWGFQSEGFPVAGAMDLFAHRVANALVGNNPSAATLEV